MNRDNETDATRRDATERDGTNATDETVVLSVADAAELLDVSAGAIRKRLERGQLHGRKVAGQWRVVLTKAEAEMAPQTTDATNATRPKSADATRQDTPDQTETTRHDRTGLVASDQARQMAALVASIQAPLLDRIEAAVARAIIAEQERDELRRWLDESKPVGQSAKPDFLDVGSSVPEPAEDHFARVRAYLEESRKAPEASQDRDVAPGRTTAAKLDDESFAVPASDHRTRFSRWWRWMTGG